MIDLHNHILPGIDDGARNLEEALEMARMAVDQGFSGIVATPHYGSSQFLSDINLVRQLVAELNQELANRSINLTIFPGMEVRLSTDVIESLSKGAILSINEGCYILLELPFLQAPAGFENFVRMILDLGKKIILAHPEKNVEIQRRPEIIYELLELFKGGDLLVQITADSVTGEAGLPALSTAKRLLENGLAHILATDAHSSINRPPMILSAFKSVASIVGEDIATKMTHDWPKAVINSQKPHCRLSQTKPDKLSDSKRHLRFFFK